MLALENNDINDIISRNDYSKSIIKDPLSRMTCFRLAIFPELDWDVLCICDLNSMLKTLLASQNTTVTKFMH